MLSTMSDYPLTIGSIFEHGVRVHAASEVATWTTTGLKRSTFAAVGARVRQLACALQRLGIHPGDRVATLCWNTQEHIEAYYAVSSMGAVVHTLNLRLFPDQLAYVINHGGSRILIVDASLVPLLLRIASQLRTVETFIVVGEGEGIPPDFLRYQELLAAEKPEFAWPALDERSAAVMCYTTGTTGDPKGVVYSHRSIYLHALGVCAPWSMGCTCGDCNLVIVPMFHASAWGIPYASWLAGSSLLMPGPFLQPEALSKMILACKPNVVAGVPTILSALFHHADQNSIDLSLFRLVFCGGAALPRSLAEKFKARFGVRVIQGWGLTETSPVAAVAQPPAHCTPEEEIDWTTKTGRIIPGVELRICDGDQVLPWDGESIGEIEVRGPWVTSSYYKTDVPEKFHDGWLRTGDVGVVDEHGYLRLTDRSKDVIKSGGEWISSVDLENAIIDHPSVLEAAVIGVPDEKWDERPLACVVPMKDVLLDLAALRAYLATRVSRWWIPERWAFITEVPKTSVGKFDKKALRAAYAKGQIVEIRSTGDASDPFATPSTLTR
ncbi:MAG TPA: long-chain fatty acid--CoA ligase [Terracidiphilus sp.]|nr:long-chain fatty acid--CoA ligase [Terracidiphilus sp.]